jgi:predicted ATPase
MTFDSERLRISLSERAVVRNSVNSRTTALRTTRHYVGCVSQDIRTPDQRLRVFVSSTLAELADERAAVARAIEALRLTPVMFELGARPHPPQELYRAYLAQSDIFIGLYWQRYGWVGPGMDISGLEDEFRLSGSLPRLIYLKSPAPDREPRLAAMIAQLQDDATASYRTFKTPRELGGLVRDDLATLLSERFTLASHPEPEDRPVRIQRSLPVTSTALIGREADVAAVVELLESPGVRLVTLTGPGGIGKTRLAIAAAAAVGERSPSMTVVFVPLASVDDPELALPRVAAAVGAVIEGTRTPLDVLVEHFTESPALVVLDNLEQLVTVAPELERLLGGTSDLKLLATSRTVLRLRAEREYPVAPLAVPSFAARPSNVEAAVVPAVQLFVDRARAVRYDFELTDANAAAVIEICRRLDGLPLAIELAAARIRLLDPEGLLARLEHVLDAFGPGPVDLPERQRSLRATIEWSVGLLAEDARELLAILSVFVGGWTVAAAADVAELTEDGALDLLDALAGHSLISVVASRSEPRFRMLTSVREFAAELLGAGARRDHVERRHAEYYRTLVEDVHWPAERQLDWVERVRVDEENVRATVRWYFDHDVTPLPHLFRVLWLFWQMGDRMPEGRQWIDQLRRRAAELDSDEEVLFLATVTAVEVGDDDSALALVEAIRRIDGPIEDPARAAALQLAISWTVPIRDDFEGALQAATEALDGLRRADDALAPFAILTVGGLEMALGQDDRAREHLSEVDALGAELGNNWLESTARTQLAVLAVRSGRLAEADGLLAESVRAIRKSQPITLTVTFALVAHAHLALARGDATRAARAVGAAEGLRARAGLRTWPSARRTERALIAEVARQLDPETYREAFEAAAELSMREAMALVAGEDAPART